MNTKDSERLLDTGRRLQERGELETAFNCYRQVLTLEPGSIPALTRVAYVCHRLKRYAEAAQFHERALALDPSLIGERYNLGIAYKELMRLAEAEACYRQVLQAQPDNIDVLHGLGIVKIMQGLASEADAILRHALKIKPGDLSLRSCLLLALNYFTNDPARLLAEHLEWDRHNQYSVSQQQRKPYNVGRPLRIGYLSPDFCSHPVAFFIEPLLSRHKKSIFEIFCYSDVAKPDGITTHLRKLASVWREVQGLSDDELAAQIRRDRIDILVDLAGHTAGNRLEVFARKPAPVQVTYLGYPNTTGLSTMDYRFTDAWSDPPGETERFYTEALVRLPNGFLCYRPLEGTVVSPLPCKKYGHVTFGSFNNLAKVTPEVVVLWSRILLQVPDAQLIMKTKHLSDAATREYVYHLFSSCGVARERLELIGWLDKMGDHLGLYSQVDIALDTFPYNGTTTTCEAMWMGVPVITLAGRTHAGRVGVSILSQVGLFEFIAEKPDEYVKTAVQLACDHARLNRIRGELREQITASSLCNAADFTRDVEQAYLNIWADRCQRSGTIHSD